MMSSIWFVGFILFILYRVFNAGMNSKALFYRERRRYEDGEGTVFDENKAFGYAMYTFGIGMIWPLAVPMLGLYKLGQHFSKES
jgi:hypothetical protein